MELVPTIIAGVITALITALLINEFKVHSPWMCRWIVRFAVSWAPQDQRKRLSEEWPGFIDETPGVFAKLWAAVGFARAAYQLRSQERHGLAETELSQIAEMAKALENAENARDQAVAADRARVEVLANVSHELRTPLNAIIGFSDMMINGVAGKAGDDKQLEYCKDINESGRHMLTLINDILDAAKMEAGKLDLDEAPVHPAELGHQALRLVADRAQRAGVALEAALPGDLPRLLVDDRKVKQILLNLLSNAIKFTPKGGSVSLTARIDAGRSFVKVKQILLNLLSNAIKFTPKGGSVSLTARIDAGRSFVFEVADTGIGIAREDMGKALSPFTQVDSDLSRTWEGTGLGLPLTKALVELHGGSLEVESEVGAGTTVTVRFPTGRIVDSPRDI